MAYISKITPLGSNESYDLKAAMLTHTPNNTTTFLRGDNTWSSKLICANSGNTTGGSYTESGLEIREYNYGLAQSDTWGNAPRMTFHWGGRVQAQIGLASNGWLYTTSGYGGDLTDNSHRFVIEQGGTWNISVSGNAATATKANGLVDGTSTMTSAYNKAGLAYADYSWLAGWNGYELRAVAKTQFAQASHNHYQLVTEGDNRTVATTPNSYNNNLVFRGLKTNTSFGSPSSDTYSYVVGLRGWSDSSGGNAYELAFNNSGIYCRNGATTSWNGWQRLATSSDLSSYVLKAGDTMSGTLHFKNITTGNYTEGIRLHPSSGGWNAITFCGTDNTGDSGTSTNTWGLFTHNGNFYIGKNGSDTAATFLRNVNGVWYWNGTAIGNASSANDISTGTPVLATATESNAITVIDLGNNVPATNQAQRHALDFKWYNSHWAIGNLRTSTSTSAGFGFSYSPDGTNWANKLIIGTNGSITIGHRETATSPSSATSSTRLTIIPYFHTGGPWTINSVDDSTNAYLTIKYGSSQITSLRHDGYMTAVRVYGAVWNDYAEYRKDNPNEIQEPGRCVRELGNGALALTTKRLERGCEIISDTFGFAIGQDEKNGYNTPIASNGRVLAYPYESIKEFAAHIGWPVCSGPNGTVSIMTEEEEEKYPSRIIGTISEIPDYEEWGTGNVKVDGRVWIRIR